MKKKHNWAPAFFADIIDTQDDSDYLKEQHCCPSCGAYTGDLPGYYWIEDNDCCPNCRASNGEEKWSDEVHRVMIREGLPENEVSSLISKLGIYENI